MSPWQLKQFQVAWNRSRFFSLNPAEPRARAKGTRAKGGRTWAGAPDDRRARGSAAARPESGSN